MKECKSFYDKVFANEFDEFLSRGEDNSTYSINKESSNDSYLQYIEYHLISKKCQLFCSRLWLVNQILSLSLCQYVFCNLIL